MLRNYSITTHHPKLLIYSCKITHVILVKTIISSYLHKILFEMKT